MAATVRIAVGDASQGEVVAFGASGGKDHLPGLHTVERGDLIASLVDRLSGALAQPVDAGGIAELLCQVRHHRLEHLRVEWRGGRVVEVHHRHHSMRALTPGLRATLARGVPGRPNARELLHGAVERLQVLMYVEYVVVRD